MFRAPKSEALGKYRLALVATAILLQPAVGLAQPDVSEHAPVRIQLSPDMPSQNLGDKLPNIFDLTSGNPSYPDQWPPLIELISVSEPPYRGEWPPPTKIISISEPSEPGREPIAPHQRVELSDNARAAAAAINALGFDVFAQLRSVRSADENLLISPLSISAALAMTYAGAGGRTAEEMADVLHFGDSTSAGLHAGYGELLGDLNTEREGYELNIVNRLFGQRGFDFKQSFLDTLDRDYAAPMKRLDFVAASEDSRVHINEWVADQTNDRIQNVLPSGSIDESTRLVLTNAVYFNGDWKHAFKESATRDATFHLDGQRMVDVPTMFQQEKFRYGQFENFAMLEMPYSGDDLSMVLMLPNELDGLLELEASLTIDLFEQSVAGLYSQKVQVHLPKFTFEDKADLGEVLQDLGMTEAFSDFADFSGIGEDPLKISDVFHKTFIDLNESGTEAAAATAVVSVVFTAAYHPPPPVFQADHPFLFALRDTHSGSLLFLGRMVDPGGATAATLTVPEPGSIGLMISAILILGAVRRRRLQAWTGAKA